MSQVTLCCGVPTIRPMLAERWFGHGYPGTSRVVHLPQVLIPGGGDTTRRDKTATEDDGEKIR
jgi:hypothetical protein